MRIRYDIGKLIFEGIDKQGERGGDNRYNYTRMKYRNKYYIYIY